MRTIQTVLTAAAVALALALAPAASAREVTHSIGVADVPDAPQRVVVLTNEGTEALLAIGITPVGAVRSWLGDPWYDHIAGQMADVTVLGEESAVDLELLAALEPDLIIGTKVRHEKIYEQLSAIAPTVISERLRGDWKVNMALYAEAVGKTAEAEAAFAAYDTRVAAISAQLGEAKAEQISLVRFMAGRTRIYLKDTFAGTVLGQIGFARPASQDRDEFADEVTKERIPDFNGDRLFYFVYETGDGAADSAAAEWMADPLWAALPVVQAGKAQPVSDAIWNTAGGIIAANVMLDDIETIYGLTSTR
ncbi:MAG: iron-siderophore ABC transporter substrate-binding protein [Alphaproteobacteria bacterium]|nr:iron-siderophore ABC transporter substrate-binding protein [Alphaproteobacteria bacterium]MBU1560111.1 iron-siderophore ABC transporter substrate-binding protein [Alphaproteobacteria bacterium]MBU2302605.1 iron-siderophore ABC transporter substrate-binding protein [Alphaproteobacteria bacterium]MBU2367593.1 iron-siderophore ABC transporter substrate-binding protein [Alphaproteobacteria bacterium]